VSPADEPRSSDHERLTTALAGRYDVIGVLGAGGMATVYRAVDRKHSRTVAIKVLRSELSRAIGSERFLREIEILAQLQHPRILPLYDSGEAGGLLYYVMPLVEGESLRERLLRERQLPLDDALRIAREVASALAYAHARGIVHRDIKPDNVLLSGGEAVVADFGIARALDAAGGARLTQAGMTVGTPVYMSPEQVTTDGEVDARSDIYSLGCLLYEMLAGRPPFAGPSTERLLLQHIAAPVPPLSASDGAIPQWVDDAIQRALAKAPADRFATASDFAAAIGSRNTISLPGIPTARPQPPQRTSATARWRWGAGAVVAVVVVVVAIAAAVFARRERGDASTADRSLVAVFPFRVSGDSSFAFLREGMVDLLTTHLGAMDGMRALDPRTVLAAWRREVPVGTDPSQDDALRLATRLGSGRIVLGEVVGTRAGVSIGARLIGATGEAEAEASVQGPADSLYVLVDRLTSQLLARSAGEPSRRLVELTSTSLPAVRAYLEGRVAYRRGERSRAIARFSEALALDSTFALAALGMASAGAWSQQAGQSEALRRGLRTGYALRDRLSARDRLLFEAYVVPSNGEPVSAAQQLAGWRRAVEGAPESAEAQFEYGDRLYHNGAQLGIADADARAEASFARALALDSTFVDPLAHLVELAARRADRRETSRLAALYTAQAAVADASDYVRWRVALTLDDARALAGLRARRSTLSLTALHRIIGFGQADGVGEEDADSAAAELRRRADTGAAAGTVHPGQTLHSWALNRGRREAAASALVALRASEPFAPGASIVYLRADHLPVLDARFWEGDSTAAQEAVTRLQRQVQGPLPPQSAARARYLADLCVLGVWHLSVPGAEGPAIAGRLRAAALPGDSAALHGADARLCALMLEAGLAVRERRSDAGARVQRLDSALATGPYVFGADFGNLLVARLHEAGGDATAALRAIRRRPYDWDSATLYLSTFLMEEGRLAALTGDTTSARRAWERYAALRAGADAPYEGSLARARAALATLKGGALP
jgi:TolB-like protein